MYPLLFGKSMNYAAGLLLYDTLGCQDMNLTDFEDFRGADVAHQWIFSPMSMIVHQGTNRRISPGTDL